MATEYPITLFRYGESKEIKTNGEEARARADGFCEQYRHQEYPKALYRNGERVKVSHDSVEQLGDGGCRVVKNAEEEKAARADGYRGLSDPAAEDEAKAQPKVKKAA
jgi:hypothetical protein